MTDDTAAPTIDDVVPLETPKSHRECLDQSIEVLTAQICHCVRSGHTAVLCNLITLRSDLSRERLEVYGASTSSV